MPLGQQVGGKKTWKIEKELGCLYKLAKNKDKREKEKEGSWFLLEKNDADLLSATPFSVNISMEERIVTLDKNCLNQQHGEPQH